MIKFQVCLSLIALVFAQTASASFKTVVCTASGKSLSNSGGGLLNATAELSFVDTVNGADLRVLRNIDGRIRTSDGLGGDDNDSAYVGNFKIGSLVENPNYRPRKYKGYSDFEKFDATDTNGSSEDGMWGNLVIEKNTSKASFQAHYIFKAGDHMGGTLHLICKLR